MKIALGCDHGGFELKEQVLSYLKENGYETCDFGTYDLKSCDYPVFARKAAQAVADGECDRGIVICTTGIGVSIVANKVKGIRCAVVSDTTTARLTRAHNDANMIAMGGGIIGKNLALDIVAAFLNTGFSGEEKHVRRIAAIENLS
ncbi:MAG: ribose 5-phosphate isomerase B [Lachnospiraceae bacterium]|nr:ribose 5-phosphate isomerase B [Lachnospiraceae bacterium]